MSVQASVNITNLVTNAKSVANDNALSKTSKLNEGNQIFSGVLGAAISDESVTSSSQLGGLTDDGSSFIGPQLPDNGPAEFLTEANIGELEGKLLPILPGLSSGLETLVQGIGLSGEVTATISAESLSSTNAVLEQLRGLLTGASPVGDSEEIVELRARLVSLLDNQVGTRSGADQIISNPILSDSAQNNLRQELSATLNNIRSVIGEYLDKIDRSRNTDLLDLNPNFFDSLQKKSTSVENLLTVLTRPNAANAELANANQTINPILSQITNLLSSNAAITQPLLTPVADSASLLPSNPTQTQVTAPLNSPQFSDELGQRIRWLVGQNFNAAQIRLNPAELGPVDVRINVSGDQVSVAFNSQFGVVREAIEAALPKLREMLENQGLNLANADIGQGETSAEQSDNNRQASTAGSELESNTEENALVAENGANLLIDATSSGLVDQFV